MLIKINKIKTIITTFLTIIFIITTINFPNKNIYSLDFAKNQILEMTNEVAIIINEEREKLGLKPLYVVPYLNEIANLRAKESSELLSHVRLNGTSFITSIDTKIVDYCMIAENLAAGSDNAKDTMEQFRNSPKHWNAITSEYFTHMGIGFVYNPDGIGGYKYYWCQIFSNDFRENVEYEGQYLPSDKIIIPADEGDINGDAVIDVYDYITLVEYIRKKQENVPVYLNNEQIEAADCFKDNIITEADAKCLMRYILGIYKSLPFEF